MLKDKFQIQCLVRNDSSSISCVGKRVAESLRNVFDVSICSVSNPIEGQTYYRCDVGLGYGLVQDLIWLRPYRKRIIGLVCEDDLTDEEIDLIRTINPHEIWVPSTFCHGKFKKVGLGSLCAIVPHGVPAFPVRAAERKKTGNVLMIFNSYPSMGIHVHRKGILETIEAFKELPHDLILRTEKRPYYQKHLGDMKNVGFVTERVEDLSTLFDQCDAVLCPSHAEGFGLVGLEALARGIPLISTKTGNDYLQDDVSYIHIDLPVTAEKIKNSIEVLYNDFDHYSKAAISQVPKIYDRYSWPKIGEAIVQRAKGFIGRTYGDKL